MLRFVPIITIAFMIGPVSAGLIGTLLPAFGILPALGGIEPGLDPWIALFDQPGLWQSVRLSLVNGLVASFISVAIVMLFCAAWQGTAVFRAMQRILSPILSVPHATAAFGLAFLIAPSGWIARLVAQFAGWERPPDIAIIHDPWGLAMIAGLVAKEIPFLFLMTLAALPQADTERTAQITATLGYGRIAGWFKATLPRIYPQIRLPVLAVLAYSTSVVDVAIILGPTTPAPLAVRILGWLSDPDLGLRFMASSAAILQLLVVVGAIAIWIAGERIVAVLGYGWAQNGWRFARDGGLRSGSAILAGLAAGAVILGLVILLVWSIAGFWGFPDILPRGFSLRLWMREYDAIGRHLGATLLIAIPTVMIAIALVLGCLEQETRSTHKPGRGAMWLVYLPLLVPQISFMFGLQVFFTLIGLERTLISVVVAHLVFVLPYVFLSLSDPFRALDPRYGQTALCHGASPARVFWQVRLPLLTRAVMTATAVGLAVTVGQYLPTLLIGAGRFATVTTEAVALASGGDRRMIGIYGLLQMVLPFAGFACALLIPAILFRHRRGMDAQNRG
ncbi:MULTISPECIES: ABC transporter permease [Thalassospira]|uniref:ABC transporter permease n=2 Tax=Thalassospira TaxID=168934 RepID=A0A367W2V4_9PROT|nr:MULTISPECIES: ABC transporter permease subunit [Thalassospira]MDG4718332.1 ABC transporter permease subunit [Thalassospira sp. FZY0004]RCK34745.1 ABC transporter permease [Thalassospira profundimaris]